MSENASKDTTSSDLAGQMKLCHIVKRSDFEGYGFNLHSEKTKQGQYIGKIDANSPAEFAGLKEGDRIIEVNGVPISNETHKQVVQRIKAFKSEVRLLLLDSAIAGNGNGLGLEKSTQNIQISGSSDGTVQPSVPNSNGGVEDHTGTNSRPLENNNNNSNNNKEVASEAPSSSSVRANVVISSNNANKTNLQLPTTAAEMRAKLLKKKKYDPKSESVDLKKKFEIIQKL